RSNPAASSHFLPRIDPTNAPPPPPPPPALPRAAGFGTFGIAAAPDDGSNHSGIRLRAVRAALSLQSAYCCSIPHRGFSVIRSSVWPPGPRSDGITLLPASTWTD